MTCYIVDDQPASIRALKNLIERTEGLSLAGTATKPDTVLQDMLLGKVQADLTFMDIDMPGMSGLELARMLDGRTDIIFTTAHRQYGPEAFDLRALDYLVKPIAYERFLKAIETAMGMAATRKEVGLQASVPYIFVPGDGRQSWIKLMIGDILYIKAESNYVRITTAGGNKLSYMSMEQTVKLLSAHGFARVHKSYIVNLAAVKAVEATSLLLGDGTLIPISRGFKDGLMKRITGGLP